MTAETLARAQGVYFAATGIWPLLHMPSFLAVTGPKKDLWLVQTVGALVTCIGGQLLLASRDKRESGALLPLAVGSAAALAAVDVIHVARKRISKVYLLDAAAEGALILAWALSRNSGKQS